MARITLVLGGTRSGKSKLAEGLAANFGRPVIYIASASPIDKEMRARIERHRRRRPASWRTVEAGADLADVVAAHSRDDNVILVDCLSLFVAALAAQQGEGSVLKAVKALVKAAKVGRAETIFVSNEVGMGIVPAFPAGRAYRDLLGEANQLVAGAADRVYLAVAGLALLLKGTG